MHIESIETFKALKEKIGTGYYEELVEKYILENNHSSFIVLKPKKGLTSIQEKQTNEKLKNFKESLTSEEIKDLIVKTKELEEYKEIPSLKEELERIPLLEIEDIKKEAEPFYNTEKEVDGVKVLHHNIFTGGILYIELLFKANSIPERLVSLFRIFKSYTWIYGH